MTRERSLFAGCTSYTAVPLGAILEHFEGWENCLKEVSEFLINEQDRYPVDSESSSVRETRDFLAHALDLFQRYRDEVRRLRREMRNGVQPSHPEAVRQLYESVRREEHRCAGFKCDVLERAWSDSTLASGVENIYAHVRDVLVDMQDLSSYPPGRACPARWSEEWGVGVEAGIPRCEHRSKGSLGTLDQAVAQASRIASRTKRRS